MNATQITTAGNTTSRRRPPVHPERQSGRQRAHRGQLPDPPGRGLGRRRAHLLRRDAAENAAESLRKGDRVLVTGQVHTEAWTDSDGAKRTKQVITDAKIGASLHFSTVEVIRTKRDQQTTPS